MADNYDAMMLLQLHEQWTTTGVGDAAGWLRANQGTSWEEFESRHAPDSREFGHLSTYLRYHETVGTLWKNKLFDEKLLFDWLWLWGAWDLVKPLALGMRAKFGDDAIWSNFEAVAEAQRAAEG